MRFVHFTKVFSAAVCAVLVVSFGSVALAHDHEADVPFDSHRGKIVTGDEADGAEYVFQAMFNNSGDWANGVELCFDSEASNWSAQQSIGVTIRDSLRKWNGSDFNNIAAEQLTISYSQGSAIYSLTTPTIPSLLSGLERAPLDGNWHKHFDFELSSPYSEGIYLLELEMFCTDTSIAKSDPFCIVFRQDEVTGGSGSLTEWDTATAYVEAHMVPEPGTIAMLASGMGAALFSLWRRRCHGTVKA